MNQMSFSNTLRQHMGIKLHDGELFVATIQVPAERFRQQAAQLTSCANVK